MDADGPMEPKTKTAKLQEQTFEKGSDFFACVLRFFGRAGAADKLLTAPPGR
jgi:hypothetical protein